MAEETAISVRGVSKKYRLFTSPQERLKEALHPFRKSYHREFWALKGVAFEVPRGQTLGIVGRNGSGKSTLLQIIAGIMQPTSGEIAVNGRVSAILELGSGFNPEFTGRENVLFQAQLVGLSREQVYQRLPDIEAFADIGEFFDQPVRTYSSGMFVRVAFATAIHVDPEILIIDEALAVGDAKFQHKCFDRFAALQQKNKTILFVSHNVNLVSHHCNRVILLDGGKLISDGEPLRIVNEYMELLFGDSSSKAEVSVRSSGSHALPLGKSVSDLLSGFVVAGGDTSDACFTRSGYNPGETRIRGNRVAEILDYVIATDHAINISVLRSRDQIRVLIKVRFYTQVERPVVGFAIKTVDGIELYATNTYLLGIDVKKALANEVRVFQFTFRPMFISGDYFVDLGVAEIDGTPSGSVIDVRRSVIHITLLDERITFNGLVDLSPGFADICRP